MVPKPKPELFGHVGAIPLPIATCWEDHRYVLGLEVAIDNQTLIIFKK